MHQMWMRSHQILDFTLIVTGILVCVATTTTTAAGVRDVDLRRHRMLATNAILANVLHTGGLWQLRMLPIATTTTPAILATTTATRRSIHATPPAPHVSHLHPLHLLVLVMGMVGGHHVDHTVRLGQPACRWILLAVLAP
uniref:Putative secreted protein n=1 Tax=Anopheles darlingi TaxID=43151 RepID=A0A2M4DED2_ANODA